MLIDHLLAALAVQNDHKAVKPGDGSPQLKAVHQKHGDGDLLLPGLGQKYFLKIICLLHSVLLCIFFVRTLSLWDNLRRDSA